MNKIHFKNKQPIAIVANDAGAANLILGWIKKNPSLKFNFCLTGPAEKILSKEISFENNNNLDEVLSKCNLLISGTSYFSMIEHYAREKAKKLKIYSIAIVDHWVNYSSRFIRKGKTVLPDNIWVFDRV